MQLDEECRSSTDIAIIVRIICKSQINSCVHVLYSVRTYDVCEAVADRSNTDMYLKLKNFEDPL